MENTMKEFMMIMNKYRDIQEQQNELIKEDIISLIKETPRRATFKVVKRPVLTPQDKIKHFYSFEDYALNRI